MSDFIEFDSEPPFADVDSVLYVETERKAEHHDNYQLILIMEALGKVKL